MLSYLDPIIFPDDCEVLELPNNRYIYPIYKNGSSSLHQMNLRRVNSFDNIAVIDVLIREPKQRFLSGVSTYLNNLDDSLDKDTALYFVKNYLFLNRHFCPQFYWLVNLRRFTKSKIRLLPFESINNITNINQNKSPENYTDLDKYFGDKVEFYLQLDKVLYYDLINQTVSFEQILDSIQSDYFELHKEIIQRSRELCNVLG